MSIFSEDGTSRNAIIDSKGAGWPRPVWEGLVSARTHHGKGSPAHFWAFHSSFVLLFAHMCKGPPLPWQAHPPLSAWCASSTQTWAVLLSSLFLPNELRADWPPLTPELCSRLLDTIRRPPAVCPSPWASRSAT